MHKQTLLLALFTCALGAQADCVPSPPEIGDIGPDSTLVCRTLQQLYPGAALREEGRAIRSPTEVVVHASVDGRPITLSYALSGYRWRLQQDDARLAENVRAGASPETE
ncbi:hypothetical protein [Thiorhodococcus minor]|uniref:DUF2845 domain-containing protein n=1 Tax=Thiorhodococcus minor TaxID=57489 RepID=A0A6M0K604_9GAMM|nr:hypothetical protein [Thiorhodococcus minor]NEV64869.1 hypothetical protein [Thiorhodococcus minor]